MINTADGPLPGDEVQVRFDADRRPLAVRHDGRIWPIDPDAEPSHWLSPADWSNGEISAAVAFRGVVSVENWRVQVRPSSTETLRTFHLQRGPRSPSWFLTEITEN